MNVMVVTLGRYVERYIDDVEVNVVMNRNCRQQNADPLKHLMTLTLLAEAAW